MIQDLLVLVKLRITLSILMCTAVGYCFGGQATFDPKLFVEVLFGTALKASGTAVLNQWYEADSDLKMHRTRNRPIPAGRLNRDCALAVGIALVASGLSNSGLLLQRR